MCLSELDYLSNSLWLKEFSGVGPIWPVSLDEEERAHGSIEGTPYDTEIEDVHLQANKKPLRRTNPAETHLSNL